MQTVKKFSATPNVPTRKNASYDWTTIVPGEIYKATVGADFVSAKGFLVSMSRYANEAGLSVDRLVSDEGATVEFRFNAPPVTEDTETANASV